MRSLVCVTYNETTQTCEAQAWVELPAHPMPPLTAAEGAQIAGAILLVWGGAFAGRMVIRALREM